MKCFNQLAALSGLALVFLATSAQAAPVTTGDTANELSGGTNAAIAFGSNQATVFNVNGTYSRMLLPDLIQGTVRATFSYASFPLSAGSLRALTAVVGPTINIPIDATGIHNAVFVRAMAGVSNSSTTVGTGPSTGTTNFAYDFEVGKRMELWANINWTPSFDMSGTTATGSNPLFSFVPVQFSFLF